MKRRKFISFLNKQGAFLIREGKKHSLWGKYDGIERLTSAVPRHNEIPDVLVTQICKDLKITLIRRQ